MTDRAAAFTTRFGPTVFGGAAIGGLYRAVDEAQAQAALAAAWHHGWRAFDTAPHYGVGLSEERVGRFLAGRPRAEFVLSTKVGRLLVDDPAALDGTDSFYGTPRRRRTPDYSFDGALRSFEQSLARLGLDRVDLLLIHDPDDHVQQALNGAYPALERLRAEGTVGAIGVGVNDAQLAETFVRQTDIDVVMIAGRYSLLDRQAGDSLLPTCADRGVHVVAAGVFNSGLLADPQRQATFDYHAAPRELLDRALAMQAACRRHRVTLRAAALQFPLRHPGVGAVVTGPASADLVTDAAEQLAVAVPEELWAELDRLG